MLNPFRRRKMKQPPYWLVSVEETCPSCDQTYAYAVEARCVGCDHPLCTLCRVTVDGEIFCTGCEPKRKAKRS